MNRTKVEQLQKQLDNGIVANNQRLLNALEISFMPRVDFQNPLEVHQRSCEYIKFCGDRDERPTVNSYALYLGLSGRKILWEYRKSSFKSIPAETVDVLNKFCTIIEDQTARAAMEGEIQPVVGMFVLKAFHGVNDSNNDDGFTSDSTLEVEDADTIAKKYANIVE